MTTEDKSKSYSDFKMTGNLYDDVNIVSDAIDHLYGMVDFLEKEVMERDKDKIATELFIRINRLKSEMSKISNESKRIVQRADIDNFGALSKYVRNYLI